MSSNVFGAALEGYLLSPLGQAQLAMQARESVGRMGPQLMRPEVKNIRYTPSDEIKLNAALESGDTEQINKVFAMFGQKSFIQSKVEAQVEAEKPKAEAPKVEDKMAVLKALLADPEMQEGLKALQSE